MIRAYHRARGEPRRNEIIVPEAAHGTNPATATMCGCVAREIPVGRARRRRSRGAEAPRSARNTAGIMLTNPITLGVFERRIEEVARVVHEAGGLLYYDGANLNAILGKVRPGDMGFDVIHMNLHKTFSTPHGGGGPGAGAVGVGARLLPFLPVPIVGWERTAARAGVTAGSPSATCRSRSAGCRRSWAMPGCCCAPTSTCALLGREGMRQRGRVCDLQCQLPAQAAHASRLRCRLSRATREPRVHRHAQASGARARRDRDGRRQAPARSTASTRRRPIFRCWCRSAC